MNTIVFAFLLTLFAGLATGIGSLLALLTRRTNTKFLSVSLGFSAGVMIYVSMIEIFVKARESLAAALGEKGGSWLTVAGFFAGMLLIALIDRFIPERDNPHEIKRVECYIDDDGNEICPLPSGGSKSRLLRTGVFTALAIAIHNFPEGLATFISGMQAPTLAVPIAIAIAIHNVPEGVAVSIPVYFSTGSRRRAFVYSFLSGLSEPIGAVVGFVLLRPLVNDMMFGIVFAMVAGIMVFISLDELLPSAREYGEAHLSIYGLISGMMVMAVSLLLFM